MGERSTEQAPRGKREKARTALLVAVAVVITVFAFLNTETVKVNWIIGSAGAPLIVVIALSFLLGAVCCYLIERLRSRGD
jgi:uncharacterized integral membrane protein